VTEHLGVELVVRGREETPRTGPVRSVHEAELLVPAGAEADLLTTSFMVRAAAAYTEYLGRISFGLLRTRRRTDHETLVLLVPWPPLLRFRAPVYTVDSEWAEVRWDIAGGLLVASSDRGHGSLRLRIQRIERADTAHARARMLARMEVEGYYPLIRGSGRGASARTWLYAQTQARIHQRVMQGYLRSMATLELEPARARASVAAGRENR
jgi:hypothetical protein